MRSGLLKKKRGSLFGCLVWMNHRKESVDLVLESLAGLEDRGVAGGEAHGLSGGRIAALTGITMLHGEGAKAEKSNGLTGSDGIDNSTQKTERHLPSCSSWLIIVNQ